MPERIQRSRAKREKRYDRNGEIRLMAEADGYVMCRRPGSIPFVLSRREWDALRDQPVLELANA